jgi:hypothetical protein
MEGAESEWDESIPANHEAASRSQDTTTAGDSPMLFEFVTNDGSSRSQIRRHAMRESWRQRNRGRSSSSANLTPPPRTREILPRVIQTSRSSSSTGRAAEVAESSDVEMEEEEAVGRPSEDLYSSGDEGLVNPGGHTKDRHLTPEGLFLDLRHTWKTTSDPDISSSKWSLSNIPTSSGQRPSLYQSIGNAEIDPFNNIRLSREDKQQLSTDPMSY